MTTEDLTDEERKIVDQARLCGLHVKKAGRHSGHLWYCFDCKGMASDHIPGGHVHQTDHMSFDSDSALKKHLENVHGVHW